MNYALIFAGGVGTRMGNSIPKQFLQVGDKPIIIHVAEKFDNHEMIDGILVVCKEEFITQCKEYLDQFQIKKVIDVIPGGKTGQESIRNGIYFLMKSVSKNPCNDIVLIHDGVRPLIDHDLITQSIICVKENGNSIAVSKAIETVIQVDEDGHILQTIDRARCRNAKAPQCFYLQDIYEAHKRALQEGRENIIDSATLMSGYGYRLYTTECRIENIKITTPNDYYMFKGMYEAESK